MRAVAYIRVSSLEQVDGHSLDAQERLFRDLCKSRGWDSLKVYREEGRSAHVDSIKKRPVFRSLLDDSSRGIFDVVAVHTLDRWSRNLRVMLESLSVLGRHGVGLVSITENIDYSTPHGKMATQMLGSVAEFFSDALCTHVKKGIGERAHMGLHLGGIPFGYQSCRADGQLVCDPEHDGGVHVINEEAQAVKELFQRYATGTVALAQLATWMNAQRYRTRNNKKLPNPGGEPIEGPRLFTTASVRGILHNAFYAGKVKHGDERLPGVHEAVVPEEVFEAVQLALRRNSGRSETLYSRPAREYLLKGLIRCIYCGMPMWAQTLKSGNPYYREQARSRSHMECPGDSKSIRCEVPDEQIGRIVGAVVLPEAWLDRVLAQVHLADEVKRISEERKEVQRRLKRLGQVYLDNLIPVEEYHRQKRLLEDRMASLLIPAVDATEEAGKLLENLPDLWEKATVNERRRILLTMLEAVYVDAIEAKAIVVIRPKPAFMPLFEIATTRDGSDVILIKEKPPGGSGGH